MAIITDIVFQKKDKDRVNLFLDGEFAAGLDGAAAIRAGLKVGREITQEELRDLVLQSDASRAFEKAAKYLGLRLVSRKKMREYLAEKGFDDFVVDSTISRLQELGYINDENYAAAYIKSCCGKYGKNLLRYKLRECGIDGNIIDAALNRLMPEGDGDAAAQAAEKYLRTRAFDGKKLYAYLVNKGFDYESARAAVNHAKAQQDENQQDENQQDSD